MKYSEEKPGRVFVIRLEDGDILHEKIEAFAKEKSIKAAGLIIVGGADTGSKLVVGPLEGRVEWRRYKAGAPFASVPMEFREGGLSFLLPGQPPAGKLEYRVFVRTAQGETELNSKLVVTRFKGAVPGGILVPHVVLMFLFMLIAGLFFGRGSAQARRQNIRFVAYNSRFLILEWVQVAHLASHILGCMARVLPRDWERLYGHPLYYLETFVGGFSHPCGYWHSHTPVSAAAMFNHQRSHIGCGGVVENAVTAGDNDILALEAPHNLHGDIGIGTFLSNINSILIIYDA